jgi:5-methylcytosine-specific restriction endonuclease McrA
VVLVYWIRPTGDKRFCYQCLDCDAQVGGYVGSAELSDAEKAGAVPFNEAGRRAQFEREQRELREEQEVERAARRAAYDEYLQSPQWQTLRHRVRMRCGAICEGCGVAPMEHVHHLTYEHVRQEFLWELVGVCGACHERVHGMGGGYDGE